MQLGLGVYVLCLLITPSAVANVNTFPDITSVNLAVSDSLVSPGRPMSVGMNGQGSVVYVDTSRKTVTTVKTGGAPSVSTALTNGIPYSEAVCTQHGVVIVGYARARTIDTLPLVAGGPTDAFDYSATLANVGNVIVSDITVAHSCNELYILDGVHRKIYLARPGDYFHIFHNNTVFSLFCTLYA